MNVDAYILDILTNVVLRMWGFLGVSGIFKCLKLHFALNNLTLSVKSVRDICDLIVCNYALSWFA